MGYISKVHGIKGELVFFLDVDDASLYPLLEEVYIEHNGQLVLQSLKEYKLIPKSRAIVKLENVSTIELAQPFLKKNLFLPLDFLPKLTGKQFYFHEVVGFETIDTTRGKIGKVTNVLETAAGILLEIKQGGKEILIPVNDHIIEKVDRKKKIIHVNCPDGLIDLYLSEQPNDED